MTSTVKRTGALGKGKLFILVRGLAPAEDPDKVLVSSQEQLAVGEECRQGMDCCRGVGNRGQSRRADREPAGRKPCQVPR
jgi:hypothetical protein